MTIYLYQSGITLIHNLYNIHLYTYRSTTQIVVDVDQHLQNFECRLRFVKEDIDRKDIPSYTDSVSTYFMVECKYFNSAYSECVLFGGHPWVNIINN